MPRYILLFLFSFLCIICAKSQWYEIGVPYGYTFNNVFISQKGSIFIQTDSGLYYSNNVGTTWFQTKLPGKFEANNKLEFKELRDNSIILKWSNDLYVFNFYKKQWKLFASSVYKLIDIDSDGQIWYQPKEGETGLYLSKDKGKSNTHIKDFVNEENCSVFYINKYKNEYTIIDYWCQNCSKIYVDFGAGFKDFSYPDIGSIIFMNPLTGTIYSINSDNKICRLVLKKDVKFKIIELPDDVYNDSPKISILGNNHLLLKTNGRYFISKDDGITWINFDNYCASKNLPSNFNPDEIGYDAKNSTLFSIYGACNSEGIYSSKDMGCNWKWINDNFYSPKIEKFIKSKEGYLFAKTCSDSSILYSENNGKTWKRYLITFNKRNYSVEDFTITKEGIIYFYNLRAVFKSEDGGKTTSFIDFPPEIFLAGDEYLHYKILATQNGFLYMITNDRGYVSLDNCITWQSIDFNYDINLDQVNIDHIGNFYYSYYRGDGTLFKYNPYKDQSKKLALNSEFYIGNLISSSNGFIYFHARNKIDNTESYFRSSEDFKEYKKIGVEAQDIKDIFCDENNNVYLKLKDGIFISKDNGKNFSFFAPLPFKSDEYTLYFNNGIYAFSSGPGPIMFIPY